MQLKHQSSAQKNDSDDSVWLTRDNCSLDDFCSVIDNLPAAAAHPLAESLQQQIPVYAANTVSQALADPQYQFALMAEWNQVLAEGAGVLCIKGAYTDEQLLDSVTEQLLALIEQEKSAKTSDGGDHFAAAGANDRLWNAHEKLCVAAPELFAQYNANAAIELISQAWLGPHYQVTAQVNVVYPGGQPQTCHRDYHMGFQDGDALEQYPAHVHLMSQKLTLQGAIAHCDMPIESGPTKLLPGSQRYLPGYLAVQRADFRDYFEANFVQMALQKGDAVFFNPALFHAAGENRTSDIQRFANLLQIGSGYGRSIEIVDRARMCKAVYPALAKMSKDARLTAREVETILKACAEGYPFPTNLDSC